MVMETHYQVVHQKQDVLETALPLFLDVQMKQQKIMIQMLLQMMVHVHGMVDVLHQIKYLVMMVVDVSLHLMYVMELQNMVMHLGAQIVLMVLMKVQIVVNLEIMQLKFV